MKFSHTIGMSAAAALIAVSGIASAASTTYVSNGYVVNSDPTCTSFGQAIGNPTSTVIIYPGPSKPGMTIISAGTSPSATGTGNTKTHVCIAGAGKGTSAVGKLKTPAGGLDGNTMAFTCYGDTQAGAAGAPEIVNSIAFTVKAGHGPTGAVASTELVQTLMNGATPICSYTADATWTAE